MSGNGSERIRHGRVEAFGQSPRAMENEKRTMFRTLWPHVANRLYHVPV
jgi:hypothetical protein